MYFFEPVDGDVGDNEGGYPSGRYHIYGAGTVDGSHYGSAYLCGDDGYGNGYSDNINGDGFSYGFFVSIVAW